MISELPALVTSAIFFLSLASCITASAIPDDGRSVITSTPESYQLRAMPAEMSGLFWPSAETNSIGLPSTLPPKSSIAILTASTEPWPPMSA